MDGGPVGATATIAKGGESSRVRLPPLWLFGALAAVLLLLAAPKDYGDVFEYHCYALDFWQGAQVANHALPAVCSIKLPDLAAQPLHELPREYGPLSLLVFSVPLLAPTDWYDTVFHVLMCGLILGVAWLLARVGPRGAGHLWLLYTLLGAMLEAAGRFDILPAALTLIALLAAQRQRMNLAYAAVALGTLLKYYPLALLPLLLIETWRLRRERPVWMGPAIFAAIVTAGEGMAVLIDPMRALEPLGFLGARCVEAEAFPATVDYFWASLIHQQVRFVPSTLYSSTCQIGPGSDIIPTVVALVGVAGLGGMYWLFLRGRLALSSGFLFVIGIAILSAKVFSVQYLLWLSPFIAYIYGMQAGAVLGWGAVCLLTSLYYPVAISPWVIVYMGTWMVEHSPLLIAMRNVVMVVVGGRALETSLRETHGQAGKMSLERAERSAP
ncbi:MAG TPA: glycosyltransferase 87 family protein [Ktedonobacterales bacterium]